MNSRSSRRTIEHGLGDRDTAAIMFEREKELGIQVRQQPAAAQPPPKAT